MQISCLDWYGNGVIRLSYQMGEWDWMLWWQMTASHLPFTRNGLKFFTRRGGLTSLEVEEICNRAARKFANRLAKVSTTLRTPPERVDFMSSYAKHLRDIIKERVNHPLHYETPLKGFQVFIPPALQNWLFSTANYTHNAISKFRKNSTVPLVKNEVQYVGATKVKDGLAPDLLEGDLYIWCL